MENAVDALKMAAAILIFIIAIGTSFSIFGTAKQTADSIIGMRDKQTYLDAAEDDVGGILYTSSSSIKGENVEGSENADITTVYVTGVTKKGDRVVDIDDVFSTIYRYVKEKYGVTIVQADGKVIARYDSVTETQYINNWKMRTDTEKDAIANLIKDNLINDYVKVVLNRTTLEDLYKLKDENNNIVYGENWRSNENTIMEKINKDIEGKKFVYDKLTYDKYEGNGLLNLLNGKKIIEVTNEIENSKYLENLLQQYQMPTVEIIYIVYN